MTVLGVRGVTRLAADRLATELSREDAWAERLEAETENAQLVGAELTFGTILSPDELCDLLGDSDARAFEHDRPA